MHALSVEHLSGLAAAVCLKHLSTTFQVDQSILRPGVTTVAGTIDITCRRAIFPTILLDLDINVYRGIKGAPCVIVTAIDGALHQLISFHNTILIGSERVVFQPGILTVILHIGFVGIARQIDIIAEAAAEDTADLDRRTRWHVDQSTTGDTLFVTGTVGSTDITAHQVDNGRVLIQVFQILFIGCLHLISSSVGGFLFGLYGSIHAHTTPAACAEYLHRGVFIEVLLGFVSRFRDVDQHITAVLQQVALLLA